LAPASDSRDLGVVGQSEADHPLLRAAVEDPRNGGLVLTGCLSLETHPWLADHSVHGATLFPGTAFLELALCAAAQVGADCVEELTLEAPLPFSPDRSVALQVWLSGPDGNGQREVEIHSRPVAAADDRRADPPTWIRHAKGVLSERLVSLPRRADAWPPPNAEALEIEHLYDRLAERGFVYGSAFQGLRAAWKDGETVYAEVSLPEDQALDAARFSVHPALLDTSLHAAVDLVLRSADETGDDRLPLPFAWRGVGIVSSGASSLRVRISEEDHSLAVTDEAGAPVLAAEELLSRPVSAGQLKSGRRPQTLHRVEWQRRGDRVPVDSPQRLAILGDADGVARGGETYPDLGAFSRAIEAGEDAPDLLVVVIPRKEPGGVPLPDASYALAGEVLSLLQGALAATGLVDTRLVILTREAVAVRQGDVLDLVAAPVWGLVRSAISEHPSRFALIDSDGSADSDGALEAALALTDEEPQLALRAGVALVPRLVRAGSGGDDAPAPLDPERTVLVTGGLSGLGSLVARHLVESGEARHLLLVSRSGPKAAGAVELRDELEQLGATVTIRACDVSDRAGLERLLAAIPAEHPLGAIVHSAGVLDDGMLASLDRERLARTMRPKVDAAWHLHELTAGLDLSQFVLFSSAAGLLGGAGQGNYAAANHFLDALAALRRARGLPAISLAWGLWGQQSRLAGEPQGDAATDTRLISQIRQRLGFVPLASDEGLELFDAARARGEQLLALARFDGAALRGLAEAGRLAPVLRGLVQRVSRREARQSSLPQRLGEIPAEKRREVVSDLVRAHAAAVLGFASVQDVDPEKVFQELGFDSLGAVELRNRLTAATGMDLSPTLAFDFPSVLALAEHLLAEASPAEAEAGTTETKEEENAERELIEEIDSMDIDELIEETLDGEPLETEGGDRT
jgi:acyl transferase domain-containing protein/acyl carrier protein